MFKTLLVCCIFIVGAASLAPAQEQKKLKPETESVLKRIDAVRTIYKVEKPDDRKALIFLIEAGASEEFLVALNTWEIVPVADSFRKRGLPVEFAKYLSQKPYLGLLATLKEVSGLPVDELKVKIKKTVTRKRHLFRLDTDYDESFSSFAKVTDPRIIRLVNYLINYHDKPGNVCNLLNLFPKGRLSNETGGVFVLKKSGSNGLFELIFLPLPPELDNSSPDGYFPTKAEQYLPIVSGVHTHPPSPYHTIQVSGPSGLSTDLPLNIGLYGRGEGMVGFQMPSDFLSLGFANQANPFRVKTVVTLVSKKSFNIDVYFRDVIANKDGTYSNVRAGTVLDLGIYHCRK